MSVQKALSAADDPLLLLWSYRFYRIPKRSKAFVANFHDHNQVVLTADQVNFSTFPKVVALQY